MKTGTMAASVERCGGRLPATEAPGECAPIRVFPGRRQAAEAPIGWNRLRTGAQPRGGSSKALFIGRGRSTHGRRSTAGAGRDDKPASYRAGRCASPPRRCSASVAAVACRRPGRLGNVRRFKSSPAAGRRPRHPSAGTDFASLRNLVAVAPRRFSSAVDDRHAAGFRRQAPATATSPPATAPGVALRRRVDARRVLRRPPAGGRTAHRRLC